MRFQKSNLLILSLLFTFLISGCQHKKPETMREELMDFVYKKHSEKEKLSDEVTRIVEKYIHKGMPVNQALVIAHNNDIELQKASRIWTNFRDNTDDYIGGISKIQEFYNPITYREIRIILETKHDQQAIIDIRGHLFAFGM